MERLEICFPERRLMCDALQLQNYMCAGVSRYLLEAEKYIHVVFFLFNV